MRRAGRTDANHADVVAALRFFGATVVPTGGVGDGFPDLLVGHLGRTYLIEVKDGAKTPSDRCLTPAQVRWHESWKGDPVYVAHSPEMAVAYVFGFVPEGEPWKKGGKACSE
jgi:hypothetical protein